MTVFNIRQGVRDFFGNLLCLMGHHDWGRWNARPLSDQERTVKLMKYRCCLRWKCQAIQEGPVFK